ncbi:MAG TPA: SDR family oxidoreductase [Gallionella sp.]
MRICVTGGCGYKGSVLVPKLLAAGHHVRVIDTCWFGRWLEPHEHLVVSQGDCGKYFIDTDTVIHLAAVANDPCGELDPKLAWETNVLATAKMAEVYSRGGVRQFIYASSASVYGAQDFGEAVETDYLHPLSDYNKTKMCAERVLLSYSDKMAVQILRPATVCGYSPRFRADVLVNMLTMRALTDGKLHLLSPDLFRPNIHIEDITDAYLWFLDRPNLTGIYNAGFENYTIRQVAQLVAARLGVGITEAEGSQDKRSYRLNSSKLLATGFRPRKTVANAIDEIVAKHAAGKLKDEDQWHNLRWMQRKAA